MILESMAVSAFNGADLFAHVARSACGYIHNTTETLRGFMAMQVDAATIRNNRSRAAALSEMGVSFESPIATIKINTSPYQGL